MGEFMRLLVEGILDSIEEFFNALTVPSRRFTFDALLVSLVFIVASIVLPMCGLDTFVSWQEAVTCSVLLLMIVLIDSSARSSIKSSVGKIKALTNRVITKNVNNPEVSEVMNEMEEEQEDGNE